MSETDIAGALIQGYVDMGLGLNTSGENFEFDPPTDQSHWAEVAIIPASSDRASLGSAGIDEHTGFMQIAFNVPLRTGWNEMLTYCQAVRDEFILGKGYAQNGQNVEITKVDRSRVQRNKNWSRVVMSVFFRAQTIRPEI